MPYRSKNAHLASLALEAGSDIPLHKQLFLEIRNAILQGRLKPGTRLPSSRKMADDLNVSRNTVLNAFDQLMAEGYISSRIGAGSYISDQLPEEYLTWKKEEVSVPAPLKRDIPLSRLVKGLKATPAYRSYEGADFSPGTPELDQFPFDQWSRLLAKHWRRPRKQDLAGNPIAGSILLREALADYLGQARGVRCTAKQILILSGSQQAIHLVIKAFAEIGDPILMEEPGYPGTRNSILYAGAKPIPVPIDEEGFVLEKARKLAPQARLACISPSHQYPIGHTMSLRRRLDLLNWAKEENCFILEDDYDSEYRYTGRPLSSLQGLDTDNRVLYVGTMSKVMFPGLRIGYLVVPPDLVDIFLALRKEMDGHSPAVAEAALAEFISEGYLAAHIRKMRLLYDQRQKMLIRLLEQKASQYLEASPQETGMHLIGRLKQGIRDKEVEEKARNRGLLVRSLSGFYIEATEENGLLLGFASISEQEMPQLVDRLVSVLDDLTGESG
ncbi:MAG: PLP-dependent aminotransferase family protein [Sneathiellales bacterium]|nr:PLP-dependent aminotransferase family protein [Sneathiellales bacterium]